ncbi:benzoyl-CoA 2,3-epoxidase subunit BoxB [Thioalkalivibrio sp. HK1]|uniref:benzoyl-CoA 2,3-epoxidase subunit BoxB n=1 Tax=Thioalkalivibrio sp. HK1 TaxID=1469245 RepID=UPI000470962A|nr:benzoyl-CoA 2,3-epoxidase subunit BoxB [Thioalkalivibrio sp. HK1]
MSSINYSERIPNNVDLASDRRLQRALEHWQPAFVDWWHDMGPAGSAAHEVYLRTATSVDRKGWANFGYTRMPDYRWGIFLAEPEAERRIGFGEHSGKPVWQQVPGEYRAALRRLIVVQGDTEPASVEQQRHLGQTCPSNYDLRNLFQINVEEGRHLWAMIYLLHAYFGRDGREEADMLLERRSGDADRPRILGAFNERTPDWLALFMFTFLTDRDGKFQLHSLTESAFDPLSRTCRFMLTEEAHHMFVGITGLARVVQRTCEVMRDHPNRQARELGVIDLATFQRYLNFHFSVTLDLFGSEVSTNAAASYTAGIKGRYQEAQIEDDHRLVDSVRPVLRFKEGAFVHEEVSALGAINERLRDDFIADVENGIARLNRIIRSFQVEFELRLPHVAFNRKIGEFSEIHIGPSGEVMDAESWQRKRYHWLPSEEDRDYVRSLMPCAITEPGHFANWIAPPPRGIDQRPIDFEYVRLD